MKKITCNICGTECINDKNILKVIVESKENSIYEKLVKELLDVCEEKEYAREEGTGTIMKKITNYHYEYYMNPSDFINELFLDDSNYLSSPNNLENLIKFMKTYDDPQCPFIEYNKRYIGFKNGVLDLKTCEFSETPLDYVIVNKYIDQKFVYSKETPIFDKILKYQFDDEEVINFIYACLGRLFYQQDNFGFMLYLMGEFGCGKSLVINTIRNCFRTYGSIDTSYEQKYGLSYLYDKDIVLSDDLPKDIHKLLPLQTFKSMVTNGCLSIPVKNKDILQIPRWKVPLLFGGYLFPFYIDNDQIARRVFTAKFRKIVDTTLETKIITNELPAFIYKAISLYHELLLSNSTKEIWQFCPEYFKETRDELLQNIH